MGTHDGSRGVAVSRVAADSLFACLFSAPQSAKTDEEYRRALEKAACEVASWDDREMSDEPASDRKEDNPKWIN
jgi:hypothetical protein